MLINDKTVVLSNMRKRTSELNLLFLGTNNTNMQLGLRFYLIMTVDKAVAIECRMSE